MALSFLPTAAWSSYGSLPTLFTAPSKCNYLTISYPTPTPSTSTSRFSYQPTTPPKYPHLVFYDPVMNPSCYPTQYTPPAPLPTSSTNIPVTNYTFLNPPVGYYYPGRCPQDWYIQPLSFSYIPASHTLARCCPPYGASPLEDSHQQQANSRRDSNSGEILKRKSRAVNDCGFSLPTLESKTIPITNTIDYATRYGPITAIAKGATTTMPAREWFSQAGGPSTSVSATGMVVMWKSGDFPDLDAQMAASKTASTVAGATGTGTTYSSSGARGKKNVLLKTGVIPGIVVGILAVVFLSACCCCRRRGCLVKKDGEGNVKAEAVFTAVATGAVIDQEKVVYNGRVIPRWFVRGLKKKFGETGHAGKEQEMRRSEEGLLGGSKTAGVGPGSQQDYGVTPFPPPPPYVAGSPSVSASEARGPERAWNETQADFAQRRMDEQRAQMLANLKRTRERNGRS